MSEQLVPSAVAQRIVVTFLTNKDVKPDEILMRLRAQFGNSQGPRCMIGVNRLKKAGQRLKMCKDNIFCGEKCGQQFLGHSRRLIHRLTE